MLHNLYGPTEASIDVSFWDCSSKNHPGIVPIGKPIWNTSLYILDSTLTPVPIGVVGELHIGGDGLARGYLNRPELTAEKFIKNPFQTEQERIQGKNGRLYKTGEL
jgi:non-ribosomal peptide synthetase component F